MCQLKFLLNGLVIFAGLLAFPAHALDFSLRELEAGERYVLASGEIVDGDSDRFSALFNKQAFVRWVALSSNGGNLAEGLRLGRLFRRLHLQTIVLSNAECVSSCFFAYLGGVNRFVSEEAKLGVHQFTFVSADSSVRPNERSAQFVSANLLDFVLEMGSSASTMKIAFRTPSDSMHIFTREELRSFHLLGVSPIRLDGGRRSDDCPFPSGFEVKDPLGLYPGCRN